MAPTAASHHPEVLDPLPSMFAIKDKGASRKRFEAVYTVVRDDLVSDFRKRNMPEDVVDYYRRVRTSLSFSPFPMIQTNSTVHGP
jgi:hypothetical protein